MAQLTAALLGTGMHFALMLLSAKYPRAFYFLSNTMNRRFSQSGINAAAKQASSRFPTNGETAHPAQPRLLLVDDDTDSTEALADLLSYRGYQVAIADNGVQALQRLRHDPHPDVLILDLSMPFMNGWELIRELGRSNELATIPVIVVSALAHTHNVPAHARLSKPVDLEALLRILGTLVKPSPPG
jgi:CheY-like chemotaxis protein